MFFQKGIIPTTIVVRAAMEGTADTAGNQSSAAESTLEFAYTDDNLPAKKISSPGESKETVV